MKRYIPIILILLLLSSTAMAQGRLRRAGGFIFHALTEVANLTAEKAISIWHKDNFQISVGSESLTSAVAAENFNANQFTFLCWVKLNFVPGDGLHHFFFDNTGSTSVQNRIILWINGTTGLLHFYVYDKDGALHVFQFDVTGWTVGDWHQIVCRLDFKNDEGELYVDGVSVDDTPSIAFSNDSIDIIEIITQIGANTNQVFQLNGSLTFLLESRSWSDAEILADYDSGNGTPFVCGPDTLVLGNYSDGVTSISYHHSGQKANATTTTTVTTEDDVGSRWADNDRVVIQDATGFSVSGLVNGSASGTNIPVDDGTGPGNAITDLDLVGVFANLNGTSHYFSRSDADFPESGITGAQDFSIQAWVNPTTVVGNKAIVSKFEAPGNKRMYVFRIDESELDLIISTDGTSQSERQSTNANLVAGQRVHIAVIYDASAGSCIFYKNGIVLTDNGVGLETSIADKDPVFAIGSSIAFDFLDGGIFNVALFNDMRTAAEILTSATNPNEDLSAAGNIIGQWMFNDAAGVTQIDNTQGDAGRDLNLVGGDTTNFGTHTRTQEAFISRNLMIDFENGGIGGHTVGDAASILSKSDVEVFKDELSLKVLNGDGTQAFDRFTIATVANAGYRFFGRFFAPATANGASRLVDVDLTAALGITVTQAGLSAGWNDIEFAFEAADTSTTIDLGSGSVTNAEFGYWDDVRVEANLVTQPGCEAADGNALPTGWSDTGSPAADETQTDTAEKHSGASSILLNNCDADEGVTQDITVVVDKYYTFSFWEKNNAQDVNVVLSGAATATIDATGNNSWTRHSYSFKASTTTLTIKFTSGAADQSGWFDDVSLVKLDYRAASTATKIPGYWPRRNPLSP